MKMNVKALKTLFRAHRITETAVKELVKAGLITKEDSDLIIGVHHK